MRGYRKESSLLRVRRSTARAAEFASRVQRPQQQSAEWECAELALRAHQSCIPVRAPFLPPALARAADVGSDRSALLRARGTSGDAEVWGIERGRCGSRSDAVLSEGTLARDVAAEYSRGTPPMGTVRGYRRGTWLLRVRRSTARAAESASGVQQHQLECADGECAELALRAHQSYTTVRAPHSCQRHLRVRPMWVGSVGSAPSAGRAAQPPVHVGGIVGAVRQQGFFGTFGRRCD